MRINACNIKAMVKKKAQHVRETIASMLKHEMISLKADVATCMDRSFLGVNVQFIHDSKLVLFTLAVVELHAKHSAENLKNIIIQVLDRYGININQLYSITTDNGANMRKIITPLSLDQVNQTEESEDENWDFDIDHPYICQVEAESFQELTFSEEDSSSKNNTETHLSSVSSKFQLNSVICAAHTLQLSVGDAMRAVDLGEKIEKARSVVRKLRTPTIKNMLRSLQKIKPILDCPTRWHSTIDMLERLLELKECCVENKDLYLSPERWDEIREIVKTLEPARIATKQLQKEQLTIGDFYMTWSKCMIATKSNKNVLAAEVVKAMTNRQSNLFKNDSFVAALLLDPRFNVALSDQQNVQAINHLKNTWNRLTNLKKPSSIAEEKISSAPLFSATNSDSDEDEFEQILQNMDQAKKILHSNYRMLEPDIEKEIKSFLNQPRVKYNETNVLNYWHQKKTETPELYKLSTIALGVPATQVSVERLFSSLKYILSPLRYNTAEDLLEDILVIRCNMQQNIFADSTYKTVNPF